MLFKLRLKNLNIEIEELKISIVLIWQKNLFIGRIAYRSNVSFRLEIIWFRLTYDQCAIKGSNPYTVISFSLVSHDNNWNISWRALPQKLLHYFVKVCQFYDFYARMPKSMSRNDSCFLVDCMNCHSSTWPLSHLTILIWSDEITVIQLNFVFFEFFSPGHFSWLGWLG